MSIFASSRFCSGHSKLDTTALYARVATKTIRAVTGPLEHLPAADGRRGPGRRLTPLRPSHEVAADIAFVFMDQPGARRMPAT